MKKGTPHHPKMHALATALDLELPTVVGMMEMLWHFAGQNTPRGDIGSVRIKSIAAAMEWHKKPELLIDALVRTGWMDVDPLHGLIIHDWPDHCEDSVKKWLIRKKKWFLPIYEKIQKNGGNNSEINCHSREATAEAEASGVGVEAEKENKNQSRASEIEIIPGPPPETPEFQAFLAIFAGLGTELSQHDADVTCRLWVSLDFPERAMAYYYAQNKLPEWKTKEVQYVPRPWTFLRDKHWTRIKFAKGRDRPATKGETAHETAARMFKEKQRGTSA